MTHKRKQRRSGTALIEFAFVLPVLFALFFGLWEWARVETIRQVASTASYNAARAGTLPGASPADVTAVAEQTLAIYFVRDAQIVCSISNEETSCDIAIPLKNNLWVGSKFFAGRQVESSFRVKNEIQPDF